MNTYEMLKSICDKIGYIPESPKKDCWWNKRGKRYDRTYGDASVDEREIIFTQEFMNKFKEYMQSKNFRAEYILDKLTGIFNNLNNPTQYLYDLIN